MKTLMNFNKKFKIPLIILLVAIGVASAYLFVRAVYVSDSFDDSTKISAVWRVSTSTPGQVQLAAKTCDNAVWYCDLNSVVADTLGDGDFVIVARADEASTLQWKSANTACDRPQCGTDGGQDGDNLVADNTINFGGYLAREYCKLKGGRLPTLAELQSIFINRAQFGTFGAGYYWSSTEYSASYAWYVSFTTGTADNPYKYDAGSVRCVQGW